MFRRWTAGRTTAVVVALLIAISVSAPRHELRTPIVTIEEVR